MSFLAPLGLLALITLPLIVLLHLMRERRRRVVVPSLLLYQLLPRRQEAQRRRRLPFTLLLLLHLLVAALLALALARPQWAVNLLGGEEHVALIIDTSTSMAASAPGVASGTRLDVARERARAIVAGLNGRSSVTLIAAGATAGLLDRGGADAAPRLGLALDSLAAGGTGSDIPGALTLAEAALEGLPDARILVLTDAASPTLVADLAEHIPALPVSWEVVGDLRDNRAIVTLAARPRSAGGAIQVYARAVNYANTAVSAPLRLFVDDELLDTRQLTFRPNGEVELTWTLPAGAGALRAELDGNDSLPADDQAALNLVVTRPLRAVLVSTNSALERALRAVPGLEMVVLDPAAYPGSREAAVADLTVFDGFLPDAWPDGGVLVVGPPPGSGLLDVGGRLRAPEQDALRSAPGDTLLDGVSLSSVDFGQVDQLALPEWARVVLSRGDQPLILRGRLERSEIAVWTFDPAGGNLTSRLAFPLLVARTVRDLTPPALPGSLLLGEALSLRPDPRADTLLVRGPDGVEQTLATRLGEPVGLRLNAIGLYSVEERRGAQVLYRSALPVNAGAAAESDLNPRPLPSLRPPLVVSAPGADAEQAGRPLWGWLAALALAVVMLEWLYVHGLRRPGTSG